MKNKKPGIGLASVAFLAFSLAPTIAAAQELEDVKPSKNLVLRGMGSFFMMGDQHFVDNPYAFNGVPGQAMINQMYVQFMKPATNGDRKKWPIVFVHGGGLSSKSWQTTPDGAWAGTSISFGAASIPTWPMRLPVPARALTP